MSDKEEIIKILNENITPAELVTIKQIFINDINSNRRFEQITDITSLLDTLEDRGVLSENNLEALSIIINNIQKLEYKNVIVNNYFKESDINKELFPKGEFRLC